MGPKSPEINAVEEPVAHPRAEWQAGEEEHDAHRANTLPARPRLAERAAEIS